MPPRSRQTEPGGQATPAHGSSHSQTGVPPAASQWVPAAQSTPAQGSPASHTAETLSVAASYALWHVSPAAHGAAAHGSSQRIPAVQRPAPPPHARPPPAGTGAEQTPGCPSAMGAAVAKSTQALA